MRFSATRDDIKSFLAASPILKETKFEEYDQEDVKDLRIGHDAPSWYADEIKGPGVRYKFRPKRFPHGVEVIIEEKQNIVFFYIDFG